MEPPMQFGLQLNVDGGYADVAAGRANQAQAKAEALEPGASFGLAEIARTALPSLTDASRAVGSNLAVKAQNDDILARGQREFETLEFVDNFAKEALGMNFINDQEAQAIRAVATKDPAKALESLANLSNTRRSDLAATDYINKFAVPRIQGLQAKVAEAQAKQVEAMKSQPKDKPLGFTAENPNAMGISPEMLQVQQEVAGLQAQMYAEIDQTMSNMIPEARDKAKKKVDEYLESAFGGLMGGGGAKGKGDNFYARYLESQSKKNALDRVEKAKQRVIKESDTILKLVTPDSNLLGAFDGAVKQLNALPDKLRAQALHPMTFYAMLSGVMNPKEAGVPIAPQAMAATRSFMGAFNSYVKQLSGAQVTPSEAERIFLAFGIPVPTNLGASADKQSPMTFSYEVLANNLKAALSDQAGRLSPDQVLNGVNAFLENTQAAFARKAALRGGLAKAVYEDFETQKRLAADMHPDLREYIMVDDFGSTVADILRTKQGMSFKRIKPFGKGADVDATMDKGLLDASQKLGEGVFGSPQSQDYNPANPYGNGRQPSGNRVEVKEGETF